MNSAMFNETYLERTRRTAEQRRENLAGKDTRVMRGALESSLRSSGLDYEAWVLARVIVSE